MTAPNPTHPPSRALSPAARLACALACALAAAHSPARAADPRLSEPALAARALLSVAPTTVPPHLAPWVAVTAAYANDELVTRTGPDTTTHGALRNRLVTTLAAGLGLFDRLELALALPLHALEAAGPSRAVDTALGDLRASLRARLLGPAPAAPGLGLALTLDLALPTGATALTTDDGLALTAHLTLDHRAPSGLLLALDLAWRHRPDAPLGDLTLGPELRVALAGELPLVHDLSALAEATVAFGLATGPADPDPAGPRKTPAELLGGLRWRPTAALALTAAAGAGLTRGYGAPDYRALLALSIGGGPSPAPPWREAAVLPPDAPRPLPPPPLAPVPPLAPDRLAALALADPDADQDGLPTPADACPERPEDPDGFADDDGCPDPDNDQDGVLDAADRCPAAAEVHNGVADDDGCPDEGAPAAAGVTAVDGQLRISDAVRFVSGSAELTPAGAQVLDQVAAFLRAHPEVARVRIEGHTDSAGDKEFNVDLAERRAWAVRAYLIAQGLDGQRLFPKGYGPTRPLGPNTTEPGRAKNRRVEFHIVPAGAAPDAAPEVTP